MHMSDLISKDTFNKRIKCMHLNFQSVYGTYISKIFLMSAFFNLKIFVFSSNMNTHFKFYYTSSLAVCYFSCTSQRLIQCLCLVGTDRDGHKDGSDSHSIRPTKRKDPIKVDISVKVVPKTKKVSFSDFS